jgi:hypothetical protein
LKRILGILFKTLGYAVLVIVCLVFLAFYALQLPEVQTQISNKATEWLTDKLGGSVTMSKVRVSWFDEVVFEDVNIKDHKDRNMIYVREVYVNAKTNFSVNLGELVGYEKGKGLKSISFYPEKIVKFDNNLDFVTLKNPEVNFIRDSTNMLNFDYWLLEIDKLTKKKKKGNKPVVPFTLDNANILNGRIRIVTENSKRQTDGSFDFSNFEFEDLNTRIEKVSFKRDTIMLVSKNLYAKDAFSNLTINNITGKFFHCRKGIRLDNFYAHLNDSHLRDRLHFSYSRPSDFGDFFNKVHISADLKNSSLKAKDIALFIPMMGEYNEEYRINTRLNGSVSDLHLSDLNLEFGQGSRLAGDAKLKGLPDLKKVHSNLDIKPSVLLAQDVAQYSDNVEFQKYIKKLERLDISGHFNGVYNDFHSRPRLVSPKLGEIVGEVNVKAQKQLEYYGNLLINKFKIGELLDNKNLDEITFTGKINGKGRKLEEANVHLDGYVSQIDFRGYNYRNIEVDGNLGQSLFEGKLKIDDPNIVADLDGRVDFNQEINTFNFSGFVGYANLKVLGFTNKEFNLKTHLDFNFKGNKLDDWLGEASFFGLQMRENGNLLQVDSMYIFSDLVEKERSFKVNSGLFDATIKGDYVPSTLIKDITTLVSEHKMYFQNTENERLTYYQNKKVNSEYHSDNYKSTFDVKFNNPKPFFDFFFPAVNVSKNTLLSGSYEAGLQNKLHISGDTDTLSIKGNEFYTTFFDYYAEKETLSPAIVNQIRVKTDKQKTGNNTLTEELVINGNWEGTNTIDFRTFVTQNSSGSLIDLRGKLDFYPEGFKVSLLPEQSTIQLIDLNWNFTENNSIDFKKQNISFTNFGISGADGQKIGLNGKLSSNPTENIVLDVDKFDIENLRPFINVDLRGKATGNLRLRNFYQSPVYVSNIHVEDFYYKKSLVGTVTTSAVWDESRDRMRISGNVFRKMEEIIKLEGYYSPKTEKDPLSIDGIMSNADMDMFLGMTGDVFSKLNGKANGKFKVTGTPKKPVFNGAVSISKGSLEVAVSGTEVFFEDTVLLTEKGFELPAKGVEIKDAPNGNTAILTGGVYYRDRPGFNVDLSANITGRSGFKMMNIKAFTNDYIFGTAYATGDMKLAGDFDNLEISGNLTSKEGTHIVIPTDGDTKIDTKAEGIPFIKKAVLVDSTLLVKKRKTPLVKTGGVKLAFNLTLTPEADGEIIFDRTNNDILSLYGDGKLTVLFDSRGEFSITGPYNVRGGKYFFSFQNLASLRRFDIADNSKIIFNGDPFDAILDIKATYTANININKVSPQLSNSTARFPVFVNVSLTDRLLTPTINYDIGFDLKQVPISGQTDLLAFEQRLRNDEQLLSRNVSSILVFNEVFPDNNMADALSQQFLIDNISSLLSNQIGNLASKINPNLEFGVRFGDFRENLLNNMQLDFSYKFMNNRVKLSGKGAFINSLEDNMVNINPNNYGQLSVGGELEYQISDDGAYKFRLYSRSVPTNYYVFYSQGNVVVSGGSLIISRNFNSFFKKKSIPLGVGSGEQRTPNNEQ